MTDQALSDVKVVEWCYFISAPFCTKLNGRHGGRVIKVEPPSTPMSPASMGPFRRDIPKNEKSGCSFTQHQQIWVSPLTRPNPPARKFFSINQKDPPPTFFVQNYPWDVVKKSRPRLESLKKVNPVCHDFFIPLRLDRPLQRLEKPMTSTSAL